MEASAFARPGKPPATDIVALLRARAEMKPDATTYTFLADGETDEPDSISFAELDLRAHALAIRLSATVEPGDRALLLYPPGSDFIAAFFGCLYPGGAADPRTASVRPLKVNANLPYRLQAGGRGAFLAGVSSGLYGSDSSGGRWAG